MKIKRDTEFDLGQVVYLLHDADQLPRMVTGISFLIGDVLMYTLSCADYTSEHYECEMLDKKDVIGNL
jgi:hypothetical protein